MVILIGSGVIFICIIGILLCVILDPSQKERKKTKTEKIADELNKTKTDTQKEKIIITEIQKEIVVMIKCPYCKQKYNESLTQCPHCGANE